MSIAKRLAGIGRSSSVAARTRATKAAAGRAAMLQMTGEQDLAKLFDQIVGETAGGMQKETDKSLNKAARQAAREAAKTILLPAARRLVPEESGFLASQLTVRASKRKAKSGLQGAAVGFRDPLFHGDTFYGGFHEFGYKLGKRPKAKQRRAGIDNRQEVEATSFLRRPLYENEPEIRLLMRDRLRRWVRRLNRAMKTGGQA